MVIKYLEYLNDLEFLTELTKEPIKKIYGQITLLDTHEEPIESVEGTVISGNINIDGKSAVRRSCSLNLTSNSFLTNSAQWGMNRKFFLEIGIENNINSKYPELLWFPQGVYVITQCNFNEQTNGTSISISGKDKMVLLNGEISGTFGQSTILDVIEIQQKDGSYKKEKVEIKNILIDALSLYGSELSSNIIINDLDNLGLKLVSYHGQSPLYVKSPVIISQKEDNSYYVQETQDYTIINVDKNAVWGAEWIFGDILPEALNFNKLSEIISNEEIDLNEIYLKFTTIVEDGVNPTRYLFTNIDPKDNPESYQEQDYYLLYAIENKDLAGYLATPLTYYNDLIASPKDTITSIIDKICSMFDGVYEYFYNVYGQFIFQKKKLFIDTAWSPYTYHIDGPLVIGQEQEREYSFIYDDTKLISSIGINPQISKVKNDFIIIGEHKIEGTSTVTPIRLRYAIDKKPTQYRPITFTYKEAKEFNRTHPELNKIKPQPMVKLRHLYAHEQINTYPDDLFIFNEETNNYIWVDYSTGWQHSAIMVPEGIQNGDDQVIYDAEYKEIGGINYPITDIYTTSYPEDLYENAELLDGNSKPNTTPSNSFGEWKTLNRSSQIIYRNSQGQTFFSMSNKNFKNSGLQINQWLYFGDGKTNEDEQNSHKLLIENIVDGIAGRTRIIVSDPNQILKPIKLYRNIAKYVGAAVEDWYFPYRGCDWREIIYRMALDYNKFSGMDNFLSKVRTANPDTCRFGKTGYEQYYTDILGFWRDVYYIKEGETQPSWDVDKLSDLNSMVYWLDFLDGGQKTDILSIPNIGRREEVVADKDVKMLFDINPPPLMYYTGDSVPQTTLTYTPLKITEDLEPLFNIASYGKSAKVVLDEKLSTNTSFNKTLNITSIPMYFLEPNTKIQINNHPQASGDYWLEKVTLSLSHNGQMTLNATEINEIW